MSRNLRHAARAFLRTPGFTTTALVTLALCLGANLTIFAVIDSVLLRPLPFPAADRLVTIYNTYPKAGVDRDGSSVANYYERRGNVRALSSVSLLRYGAVTVGEAGATERMDVIRVTPEFFTTLGVGPVIGRGFTDVETSHQTANVAIVTDAYWRQRLNADPKVIGRTIRIDGVQKTIVGVLPPGFRYLSSSARLFLPLASNPDDRLSRNRHSGSNSDMIARLAPGASVAEAQSQIDAQNALLQRSDPEAQMMAEAGYRSVVLSLHGDHVATIRPTLLLMQAGVLLLVLIGGVNLVNLLLIRASARAREMAIRQSMGASRFDIVRQLLTETGLLTVTGGTLGLFVAWGGISLLRVLGVDRLPLGAHVQLDGRLALLALAGAALLGMVLALPVAWFTLRAHLADMLKSESRGGTAGRAAQRLRHGFIVAQVSLAFVLLAGSGLLGVSLKRAMAVQPGFRADHVLTGHLALPGTRYNYQSLVAFTDRLMEAVRGQPGVTAVGAITNLPLTGNNIKSAITVAGYVTPPGESVRGHYSYGVVGDYFSAMGIPLREGRLFTDADMHGQAGLAIVDEDFARRYWPNGNVLGQQLHQGAGEHSGPAFTVVGVVGAVKQVEVTENQRQGAVYFPFPQRADGDFFVVTRTSREPEALAAMMVKVVRALDPELPVEGVRSMDVRIADSLVARRSPALLAAIFAGVALLLASIGTYGVLSYAVAQRRREIGVRMALGAQPRQIGSQFLSVGLELLVAGSVLGVAGTWLAGRFMQSMLFDVPALHLATLATTAAVMALVSLVACLIPARRAARVDPLVALRAE